jgi:uncharacterized protein
MNISFGGDFSVKKTPDEVYDFLTDASRFCPLLPDYKSMEKEDDRHFTVTLLVGISHIRGDAKVKMELLEADRPTRAVYQGKGSVAGGTATLTAGFTLEKIADGTKVNWTGQSQIVGRLASLAGGLLEPLAKKNVQKLIDSLQAALT